jgi:hypothetical protein
MVSVKGMFSIILTIFAFLVGAFFIMRPPAPADDDNLTENIDNTNTVNDTPAGNITDIQMQSAIENYIDDFNVEITPWTPSGTGDRVRVSVTNIGNTTYEWALIYIVFIDELGNTVRTAMGGAYSHIAPNDTVSIYISADGLGNAAGFVYAVENQHFVEDPDRGLMST